MTRARPVGRPLPPGWRRPSSWQTSAACMFCVLTARACTSGSTTAPGSPPLLADDVDDGAPRGVPLGPVEAAVRAMRRQAEEKDAVEQPPVFLGPAEVDVRLRCAHVAQAERRRGDRLWRHRALGTKHVVALDVNSADPEQSRARCPAGGAELKKQHRTVCQGPVQVAVRKLGVAASGWITARIPLDRDEVQLPVANGAERRSPPARLSNAGWTAPATQRHDSGTR